MLSIQTRGGTMAKTRDEIDSILDELERELPELLKDADDQDDFWLAFVGLSDAIEDDAAPADLQYVRGRIDRMLAGPGQTPPKG